MLLVPLLTILQTHAGLLKETAVHNQTQYIPAMQNRHHDMVTCQEDTLQQNTSSIPRH